MSTHNLYLLIFIVLLDLHFYLFKKRQIPDLPLATAGPSKKRKQNKSGIEGRIMDPIARSAAQRDARNAARLPSPAPEEAPDRREGSVVIVVLNSSIVSPPCPSTPRHDVSVSYFILLISILDNILGYRLLFRVVLRLVFQARQHRLFTPDER